MQGDGPQAGHSNYLDFELEIGRGSGREYPVAVLRSPAGEARATMHFPFDELALDLRLGKLQIALLRSGGTHRRVPTDEERAVQDFGQALFDALLGGEIRSCYDVSLREAAQRDRGLRLKLRIHSPELNALPWEFLYDSRQAEYVCLSRQTPIVRYLESPHPVRPLTVSPPLRILGMIASPQDQHPLDVEREKQRVERAIQGLRERALVELEWLPGQTWRHLHEAMWGGPWHIFHFIGHGGFDANTDEGFVALADSEGQTNCLSATRLGRLLADHTALRLVLLNSCEGAKSSGRDIFSSTASILVRRGIPAALAMQYEITDRAAIEFARTFYYALASGMAVDEAVVAARKAISLAVTNSVEWGTPVLYMRTADGVLFRMSATPSGVPAPVPGPEPPPQVDTERERQLEQLYLDGLDAFWVEEWDQAARCFQAVVDQRPKYRDAATRLREALRRRDLAQLYAQAQTAREASDWPAMLSTLEKLVAAAPEFKDAAALLELAKRQKRLADLYTQAQQLHHAGRWQAVINVFAQISALEPDRPDPEALLASAQREMEAEQRRAEVSDLYSRAGQAVDAGQWAEARELLSHVQDREPGYRETERLLARADAEIQQQEAEHQRQEQIARLYTEAQSSARAGAWQQALAKMDKIRALEPQFDDPAGIAAQALGEVERQQRVGTLYEKAETAYQEGRWAQAIALYKQLLALEPSYRDAENRVAQAQRRQRMAELYAQALAHLQAQRWEDSIEGFQAVVEVDPAFGNLAHGNAATLLARARQEKEMAELPPPPKARRGRPTHLPEEVRPQGKPGAPLDKDRSELLTPSVAKSHRPTSLPEEIRPRAKPQDLPEECERNKGG